MEDDLYLKKWIKSDEGHLSNKQASLCILENAHTKLKYIVLSHLSENNNTPLAALGSFSILKERKNLLPRISVSGRKYPSCLLKI